MTLPTLGHITNFYGFIFNCISFVTTKLLLILDQHFTGFVLQNCSERFHNICRKTPAMEALFSLETMPFLMNFEKFSRTAFLIEHLRVVAAVI